MVGYQPLIYQVTITDPLEAIEPEPVKNMEDTMNKLVQDAFAGLQSDPILGPLFQTLPQPPEIKQVVRQAGQGIQRTYPTFSEYNPFS